MATIRARAVDASGNVLFFLDALPWQLVAPAYAALSDAVSECGSRLGHLGEAGLLANQCKTMMPLPRALFPSMVYLTGLFPGSLVPVTIHFD